MNNNVLKFCVLLAGIFFSFAVYAQTADSRPSEKEVQTQKLFIEANKEKVLGNLSDAAYLFGEVLKKDGANHAAYYELAKINVLQQTYGKAKKNALAAIDLSQDNLWYNSLLAEIYDLDGNYKAAAEVYQNMSKIAPDEISFYFSQAEAYMKDGKTDQAVKAYNEIETKIGATQETVSAKYSIYMEQNKPTKAAQEIERLVKTYPKNTEFRLMLAEHYEHVGDKDKAVATYKEILAINPDEPIANLAMAESYHSKGDNSNYLHSLKGIFGNPDVNIDVKIQEIVPYIDLVGKTDDPELVKQATALTEVLTTTHKEDAKAFAVHGDMLNHADQPEAALKQYQKAVEINSNVFTVWEQILFINSSLGQTDELLKNSSKVMDIFPNQPMPYFFNGMANSQNKKHEEAVDAFEQAALMSGKNVALKEQVLIQLGGEFHRLNQSKKSNEAFDKALELNEKNPLTLNNYSYYLAERGEDLGKAEKMSEQAVALKPESISYMDTYGWVMYKQKKYKEAKKWIGKALEGGGRDNPTILENYGDTLYQLQEVEEAVKYWQMAVTSGATSEKLNKKIATRKLVE